MVRVWVRLSSHPIFTNDIPHFSRYFQSYCTEYNDPVKLAVLEVDQVFYHRCTYPLSRCNIINVPTYGNLLLAEHENSFICFHNWACLIVSHFGILV